jgi:hypothetical protein
MTISQFVAQLQMILANQGGCVKLAKVKRNPYAARMSHMPTPFAPPVVLSKEDRERLEALTRAHSTPQALVFRCRLILRLARPDRPSTVQVANEFGCSRNTVILWRTRYLEHGLAGLRDAPRSGRPRSFSPR